MFHQLFAYYPVILVARSYSPKCVEVWNSRKFATRKRHKTTLKLVVRVWVRALDLASGGPVCSLVCLRAGCYMQPLGFLGGGTRFRGCMASRPRSYSTPTLWCCASVFSPSPFKREAPRPFFLPLFTEVPSSMEFSEVRYPQATQNNPKAGCQGVGEGA